MWLIAGLGNPGREYAGTRHNLGFEVVELLAERWAVPLDRAEFSGRYGKGPGPGGQPVVLLEPMTWMNRSGESVAEALRFFKVELGRLIVVLDDMALPVGQIRLRTRGSAGGHRGLDDIVGRLAGNDGFGRVRIGIGAPPSGWTGRDYVLARIPPAERETMADAIVRSADAVETWLAHGAETAMNRYNAPLE